MLNAKCKIEVFPLFLFVWSQTLKNAQTELRTKNANSDCCDTTYTSIEKVYKKNAFLPKQKNTFYMLKSHIKLCRIFIIPYNLSFVNIFYTNGNFVAHLIFTLHSPPFTLFHASLFIRKCEKRAVKLLFFREKFYENHAAVKRHYFWAYSTEETGFSSKSVRLTFFF